MTVKILGKDFTAGEIIVRALIGTIIAGFIITAFYIVPFHFDLIVMPILRALGIPYPLAQELSSSFVNDFIIPNTSPAVPAIVFALAGAAFLHHFLKKTKLDGPTLIVVSVLWIMLIYTQLQVGNWIVKFPQNLQLLFGGVSQIMMGMTVIMLILMLPHMLRIIKGAFITLQSRQQHYGQA